MLLLVLAGPARAAVTEVAAIGLTVRDLKRELEFYTNQLSFQLEALEETRDPQSTAELGLRRGRLRTAHLRLGNERLRLTEHPGHPGRPIPADSRSHDRWFQHVALVVRDMAAAYAHLQATGVAHVSTAPQTLPSWNPDAGGIQAFYFRDPEDHVLEVIWFPPGKGNPQWQALGSAPGAPLFLGIDHTAIVVGDTARSLAFYRDHLGLAVAGQAHNFGVEQEHLNQVFGANVRITALRSPRGPGVEFLEYVAPPGGRSLPADANARDLVFWTTHLHVDQLRPTELALRQAGAGLVSKPASAPRRIVVRDPDGHALVLSAPVTSADGVRRIR